MRKIYRIFRNPLRFLLNEVLPQDQNDSAGLGPFRLPDDARWMERAAHLHDLAFRDSPESGDRLSAVDAHLFWRWAMEANSHPDPIQRCKRMGQICKYWPLARAVGRYVWK
jgi:hypothetical protein